ncbi:MAG: hypothetical protein QXI91_07455 [Candidatus Bathyarchaeia archaeon]
MRGIFTEKPETSIVPENRQNTTIPTIDEENKTQFMIESQEIISKNETELDFCNFANASSSTPQRQGDKMPSEQFLGLLIKNCQKQLVKTERTRENKLEENWIARQDGSKVHLKTGEVWHECTYCAEQGRCLFFVSEHDLNIHLKRFHSNTPNPKINGEALS